MLAFLIYILYIIFCYATKSTIHSYEVRSGSLAKINIYEGIAIREEKLKTSDYSGYISYFAREGEHVGMSDYVYSIDQSGTLNDIINSSNGGENKLSNEDLEDLKNEIIGFSSTFNKNEFSRTYDFMYSINGIVLKYANKNLLDEISKSNTTSDSVKLGRADETGYVVYSTDGFESISVNNLDEELFDRSLYEREQFLNTTLVDNGQSVYKLITSDEWSIAIQLDEDRASELMDAGYVDVRFLKDRRVLKGQVTVYQNIDKYYGILTFNSSVASYCTDRFIDIEIITNEQEGLKIPLSSLVHKEFYLVPEDYVVEELPDNKMKFLKKAFLEDGTLSTEEIILEVYSKKDNYLYIDDSALKMGDYFIKPDGLSEYPIATKGELLGVYNMNMGYADFREISILFQNEEYAIVKSGSTYGLREYDYIVLDSETVTEDYFVYE